MPVTRLPDEKVLAKWVREGVVDPKTGKTRRPTLQEMVEEWENQSAQRVTTEAFRQALIGYGLWKPSPRRKHTQHLPWPNITREHNDDYWATRLRILARRDAGKDLKGKDASKLRGMATKLKAAEDAAGMPVSIFYHPKAGFRLVERRKGDQRVSKQDPEVWVAPPREHEKN